MWSTWCFQGWLWVSYSKPQHFSSWICLQKAVLSPQTGLARGCFHINPQFKEQYFYSGDIEFFPHIDIDFVGMFSLSPRPRSWTNCILHESLGLLHYHNTNYTSWKKSGSLAELSERAASWSVLIVLPRYRVPSLFWALDAMCKRSLGVNQLL